MFKKRFLVFADGTHYAGYALGSDTLKTGEIVFNTAMTGYQETISDPSYTGQIITFTYPLIGNYGINKDDFESRVPGLNGVVVREACFAPSNFRSAQTLHELLKTHGIPGISGVDTRSITRKIRDGGVMRAGFANTAEQIPEVVASLADAPQVAAETPNEPRLQAADNNTDGYRVVMLDYGRKENIIRELTKRGCQVIVAPHSSAYADIQALNPAGVVVSNGPGDPQHMSDTLETVRKLVDTVPFFGICLGHQLFALSQGATTYKLKFGHRGANHPVKHLPSGRIDLTSQNHGYAVAEQSLQQTELEITHIALNDGTVEGLRHRQKPAFSVQYHPEAAPGPQDSNYLFDEFIEMIRAHQQKGN